MLWKVKLTVHVSTSTFRKRTCGYFELNSSTLGVMALQGPHLMNMKKVDS